MIELLAVIVILAVLLGVTTVSVFSIRRKQEEQNYKNTISSILTGAKAFTAEHPSKKYPDSEIKVKDLIDGEYIDYDKCSIYTNIELDDIKAECKVENSGIECSSELIEKKCVEKTPDVIVKQCSSNPIKVEYVLNGLSDCGCQNQEEGVSEQICDYPPKID